MYKTCSFLIGLALGFQMLAKRQQDISLQMMASIQLFIQQCRNSAQASSNAPFERGLNICNESAFSKYN
jgi:hypothetical protein